MHKKTQHEFHIEAGTGRINVGPHRMQIMFSHVKGVPFDLSTKQKPLQNEYCASVNLWTNEKIEPGLYGDLQGPYVYVTKERTTHDDGYDAFLPVKFLKDAVPARDAAVDETLDLVSKLQKEAAEKKVPAPSFTDLSADDNYIYLSRSTLMQLLKSEKPFVQNGAIYVRARLHDTFDMDTRMNDLRAWGCSFEPVSDVLIASIPAGLLQKRPRTFFHHPHYDAETKMRNDLWVQALEMKRDSGNSLKVSPKWSKYETTLEEWQKHAKPSKASPKPEDPAP